MCKRQLDWFRSMRQHCCTLPLSKQTKWVTALNICQCYRSHQISIKCVVWIKQRLQWEITINLNAIHTVLKWSKQNNKELNAKTKFRINKVSQCSWLLLLAYEGTLLVLLVTWIVWVCVSMCFANAIIPQGFAVCIQECSFGN